MNDPCGQTTKIALVNLALGEAIKAMVLRSMRETRVQPRYHIAMFAYSNRVIDVFEGLRTLPEIIRLGGIPQLIASGDATDTAAGFAVVENFLLRYLSTYRNCPAPLVCHLTDALRTTQDPSPIVERIRSMAVEDGAVLVENILMVDHMLRKPVKNWYTWSGVLQTHQLRDEYAKQLFTLSSPVPEAYRRNINNFAGYQLEAGAKLFFPGTHVELVRLALAASSATQL